MPLTLTIQGAAPFANTQGGLSSVGPIAAVGTITPVETQESVTSDGIAVAVPTGAVGVLIVPPSTNTYALTARTTLADTGVNLPRASASLLLFDSALLPGNLYLRSGTSMTGTTSVLFF